jgi:ATP-dependent Clp protease protease subunit
MKNRYYQLYTEGREATLNIYGDITAYPWEELGEVSANNVIKQLEGLDVDVLHVRINSYGGEVSEGWAIYNALKNHKAVVKTYCDGFACSIASVIFMAGAERIMNSASMLMIHNPWTIAAGTAEELRKAAEMLEKLGDVSKSVYLDSGVTIDADELQQMLDAETWITPTDALEMGFATAIISVSVGDRVSQSARRAIFDRVKTSFVIPNKPDPAEKDDEPAPESPPDPPAENRTIKFFNALMGGKD